MINYTKFSDLNSDEQATFIAGFSSLPFNDNQIRLALYAIDALITGDCPSFFLSTKSTKAFFSFIIDNYLSVNI